MKRILVAARTLIILPLLFTIFSACTADKPSDSDIKSFMSANFPLPSQQLGALTLEYSEAKIRNQWADENIKGVYFIEVEYEIRGHSRTKGLGDVGTKGFIATYRFVKKGEKWEVERKPIKQEVLWNRAKGW